MNKRIQHLIVYTNDSIKKAMRVIYQCAQQMVFVINRKNQLIGTVTDGDIRRGILKGIDIKEKVLTVCNCVPIVITQEQRKDDFCSRRIVKSLHKKLPAVRIIPLVDNKGCLTDVLNCSDLQSFNPHKKPFARSINSVLVMGGAGYLGSVLVRQLLARGYGVKVVDSLLFGEKPIRDLYNQKKFFFLKGDIRNIAAWASVLRDVDAVINLAAVVGDPACANRPEETIEVNYLANKILAEACKYHQINRFLFASTCSVYGEAQSIVDENSPLHPVSFYARSKIQSEQGILSLEDENFSPTILRMSTLYGYSPRMRFDLVVNTMTMTAIRDRKINVHGGCQWRPFLNVEDAARAYVKCLESPLPVIKGEIFNVGDDKRNLRIEQIAAVVSGEIPRAKVVCSQRNQDARNYFVSFKKIRNTLDYTTEKSVQESVKDIIKAHKAGWIRHFSNPHYYNIGENR